MQRRCNVVDETFGNNFGRVLMALRLIAMHGIAAHATGYYRQLKI